MWPVFRRRNYLTKKEFQTRFILPFFLASLLINVATVALFITLARNKIENLLYSMRLPPVSAGILLSREAFLACAAAAVAVSVLFFYAARGRYQKIAPPLAHIRADLHKIADGDLGTRVSLWEEDEFRDFAGEINVMVDALSRRFHDLKKQADGLARASDALKASPGATEARAASQNMKQEVNAMKEQIRSFTL